MKICRFDAGDAGLIDGDSIYPLGDALAATGAARPGATMAEVVDALANKPSAAAGLAAARTGKPVALASAKLRAPDRQSAGDLGGGGQLPRAPGRDEGARRLLRPLAALAATT